MQARALDAQRARGGRDVPARPARAPARITSRSACARVSSSVDGASVWRASRISTGTASAVIGSGARMAIRSTTLRSSRMLPGHRYARSASKTAVVDPLRPEVVAAAELVDEVLGERPDVLGPLPQRRHADRHDAQPVVEVLAEPLLRHQRRQVLVGGRDDADGHVARLLAADALELPFLQHAQQLGLRRLVQVAHFVEEDGAAVGQLELAAPARRSRP